MTFHQRNTRLLLIGDGLSAFGTWIDFIAILTLAAYQFNVSPYEMAWVSAAGLLPGILMGPWVGRCCDGQHTQAWLLSSIAGRMAATAALLLNQDFALFLALISLRSVFASVAPPAINVLAVRLVALPNRPQFFSVLNVLNNSAKVLAPGIGTVSSSISGEALALAASLLFSATSWVVFAMLRAGGDATAAAPTAATSPAATTAEVDTTSTRLLPLLWVAATCAFFIFMTNNLVPLLLKDAGFDKALLGLLVGASGAGNIVSGLWLARRGATTALRGALPELMWPATAQALGFGAIGLVLWLSPKGAAGLLCAIFFLIGMCSARYAIALSVFVATHHASAPGRIWGVLGSWQNTMILLAPMVGAWVLGSWGAGALFAVATGTALVSFALLTCVQQRLKLQ